MNWERGNSSTEEIDSFSGKGKARASGYVAAL
jgi:hypothetical protein